MMWQIQEPTTKKLSQKKMMAAVDCHGNRFQKLFLDEAFHQIPRYPGIYISQYARLIQTRGLKQPRLLSPSYDVNTGYTTIVLTNKKGKRKCYGVHDLVARVWLKKPSFKLENEPLDVHHRIKVKQNLELQPINVNFAENLQYVYRKYHKTLDSIKKLRIKLITGAWRTVESIEEIAAYYGVTDYSIYELLNEKPVQMLDKKEYYIKDIPTADGKTQSVVIEVKKYATPPHKKSTKKQ